MQLRYYACPTSAALPLATEPHRELWGADGTAIPARLAAWLGHLESIARPRIAAAGGAAALSLTVAAPRASKQATASCPDLLDHLRPVVRRLGQQRFVTAWAERTPDASSLCIGPALDTTVPDDGWHRCVVRTTCAAPSASFCDAVRDAVPSALLDLPSIDLHIAYALSPRRDWTTLWRPTLDALGACLTPDGSRRRRGATPSIGDRIERLALHRMDDDSMGRAVGVRLAWRSAC